jgi:hypothetical protein
MVRWFDGSMFETGIDPRELGGTAARLGFSKNNEVVEAVEMRFKRSTSCRLSIVDCRAEGEMVGCCLHGVGCTVQSDFGNIFVIVSHDQGSLLPKNLGRSQLVNHLLLFNRSFVT